MAILTRDEVVRSLDGAGRLFIDRPEAMRFFDVSVEGFWRSFAAILLVAPSFALASLAEYHLILSDSIADEGFSEAAFAAARALSLCVDWVAFPILLALVAGRLGLGGRYASYVVARNWCSVLALVPFGMVGLLFAAGVLGPDVTSFLWLAAVIAVLRYNFVIARRGLGVGTAFAIGVVAVDFLLSLSIAAVADSIIGL